MTNKEWCEARKREKTEDIRSLLSCMKFSIEYMFKDLNEFGTVGDEVSAVIQNIRLVDEYNLEIKTINRILANIRRDEERGE